MNISFKIFRVLYGAYPEAEMHKIPLSKEMRLDSTQVSGNELNPPETDGVAPELKYRMMRAFGNQPLVKTFARKVRCRMRDSTEAFMSTTVALGRKQDDSGIPGYGVNSPLGCAPDYISYSMLIGPAFATKMHVLTKLHSSTRLRGGEMVRSLVGRIGKLFRDAAVVPQLPQLIGPESASDSLF